ncbi:hypothetical protein [Paenibacillus sp. EPM92]|uniref:hypothetical protein n=1 Tax=Paenibacillus sp. EPM92 TaxID=1561195 RepID=UPI001915238F|nr:hypothetical protein [Paenibacillus sp. EPM92]
MINLMRHQSSDRQRNVERNKDSSEHEDNLSFTFFDEVDGSTVDVGIGTEIDPILRHSPIVDPEPPTPSDLVEPAHEDDPQPETDQPTPVDLPSSVQDISDPEEQVPQDEIKPSFGLIIAAAEQSDNPEPENSSIDDLKEQISKSAKLFEDTRSHISSRKITVNQSTQSTHSTESAGFLDIEEESVEAPLIPFDDVEKLDEEYVKPKDNVGGLIIEGNQAATDQSGAKSREPWLVSTFIVAPIRWLFRALYYHGVREIIGFIGNLMKFLLISAVLTVGAYIVMAHTSDSGLSALEMATQHYEVLKKVGVTLYYDISSAMRGN